MSNSFTSLKRLRDSFGKIKIMAEMPSLIEVQKKSYSDFLQYSCDSDSRIEVGLQEVLNTVFPIVDFSETAILEFVSYSFDEPKYDIIECQQRGLTYASPLKVTVRLMVWETDEDTGSKEIKSIKEQDVYMSDVPLMSQNGTFIVNGTERVIVSQMHRSPGVFFDHDRGKNSGSGKLLYSARIIPYRGSWLDFEFDAKDLLFFRIDRKRKLLISTLLYSLGMTKQEIIDVFYDSIEFSKTKYGWSLPFNFELFKGMTFDYDLVNADTGEIVVEKSKKLTPRLCKKLVADGLKDVIVSNDYIAGFYSFSDVVDNDTNEVIISICEEVTDEKISLFESLGHKKIKVLDINNKCGSYIRDSIMADKVDIHDKALIEIYKVMRPGEPPSYEAADLLFNNLFFNDTRYDLSVVGRVKINARLKQDLDENFRILAKNDIIEIVKILVNLADGIGEVDDIDHLGNRRVRCVGELIENQFRLGFLRMERAIVERMNSVDIDTVMPNDLINSKILGSVVKEFFGTSQLSQFMDQTNPLAEVTHKRRLSALGPGGLTRERAGFEVRDVHSTHYGRICPIETPEGPNIGLINSLATYARINKHGFIESPYRKVVEGIVTDEIRYLSAIEEEDYIIAQANEKIGSGGKFISDLINCRQGGEFVMSNPQDIDYMDVSPKQVVSVATSLIPFLENDDANRALMGANMQRQAVPLIKAEAPLVGTGMESVVAHDSGVNIVAKNSGTVVQVDGTRIVIQIDETAETNNTPGVEIYNLIKYQRSNQNTCINQRPLVKVGDKINKGDVISDGPSTDIGELALGRNVLVAFMPWNGYNYEDSILISERLVQSDAFTSIHIEEFEVIARDTRLGPEEVTRDIPNIGEESLKHLDEVGIVHVGAEVNAGDILVGKVTPKSESPMTPEEKLLRAIFGEKAVDVRDSSLRLSPGVSGTVVEVRIFSRRGLDKDERSLICERMEIDRINKDKEDELYIVENYIFNKAKKILLGQTLDKGPKGISKGDIVTEELLNDYRQALWLKFVPEDESVNNEIQVLATQLDNVNKKLNDKVINKIDKLQSGDDLPQGALKVVKVFVAVKHKLQPGDKMAGRHGNKGVISKISPVEDMPYLEDGTPVDIVLNPLGVPSRMNIGQILETHLGWASANLGKSVSNVLNQIGYGKNISDLRNKLIEVYENSNNKSAIDKMDDDQLMELATNLRKGVPFATPVFDGAKGEDIVEKLETAGLFGKSQSRLINGKTGEFFDRDVTVGYIYMLKLHHLVDDKMHARSIGPYSLVTQQPLGGKSHFGGQRFGEMECWALQAYGASYTLQEMLTVKSDDVAGRIKIYESIVKGDQNFECGIPESFNVMVKELRSLCLNMELVNNNG